MTTAAGCFISGRLSLAPIGSFPAELTCKAVNQGVDAPAAGGARRTLTDSFLQRRDPGHGFGALTLSTPLETT
jgi:hypothetical protein